MRTVFNDYAVRLNDLGEESMLRTLPPDREGRMIDLSGNDYLGLSLRADEFMPEFIERFKGVAMTSSASRLLAARQRVHSRYERYLEELYGRPALLFNSGYHANAGIISALSTPGTTILADKLIHASAIDGLRVGNATFKRFRHNDIPHLKKIIAAEKAERIVIAVESIYSMDGDEAPLRQLAEIRQNDSRVMLYVDEAHAFGVRGDRGLGLTEELGLIAETDIIMATLGKAAASYGAFAITTQTLRDWLVNTSRPLIFSTALPPVNVAWSHLMTEKITGMREERMRLRNIGTLFARHLKAITGQDPVSHNQIQPMLTGSASKAVEVSEALKEHGIDALPIRRPTVPPGSERIRFSLHAALSDAEISKTASTLADLYNNL